MAWSPTASRRLLRLLLLAALAAALVGAAAWHWQRRRAGGPPRHLVLISLDTLRADHLGAYGYDRPTSPRFDAYAARGALFLRAVAQGPSTIPSHAALFTSVYHSAYVRPARPMGPPPAVPVLPELLRAHGFATAAFVDGGYLARPFGFDRGFDHYEDRRRGLRGLVPRIETWLRARADGRLFLFVHTYDIHTPYRVAADAPPPFAHRRWRGRRSVGAAALERLERAGAPPGDLDDLVAIYDAGIRHADAWFGRLLDVLAARGILDDAVVVVTADHGEEFFEHGRTQHKQLYLHPHLHVPLLIAAPRLRPRRVPETVQLIDVVPTVLELLGLPPFDGAMGRSLAPRLEGAVRGEPGVAYAEGVVYSATVRTVITDRWQLLYDARRRTPRLYDLAADPAARVDRAAEAPAVTRRLMAVLRRKRAAAAARRVTPLERPIPAGTRRKLIDLGYVEEAGAAR